MTIQIQPLKVSAFTLTTALGEGVKANWDALQAAQTGLKPCDIFDITDLNTWVGEVAAVNAHEISADLKHFACRNNNLADLALAQDDFSSAVEAAVAKYGADRVAVYLGTSTSGIQHTEMAYASRETDSDALPEWYRYESTHNLYSPVDFVRQRFGIQGPCMSISTACSSSAKVFAAAQRAIAEGLVDAAVVGGVDTLCFTTLYGFNSLQVVAEDICRPSDSQRGGISIGEAAGFALVERDGASAGDAVLLGFGESADAHHMSTPHPEGLGAKLAMQGALDRAGIAASDIGYVNLHGTGTVANDASESKAVHALFGDVPCSSTKGWTGHTLGAAGIVESIFCLLSLKHGWLPHSLNTREVDADIHANILREPEAMSRRCVLTNSFGFGGSNCSLVFGAMQ